MRPALRSRVLAALLILATISAVVTAVSLDPPGTQRLRRMDTRREADLNAIENAVGDFWKRHGELPADLARLEAEPGIRAIAKDPQSGQSYSYEITASKTYKLCAEFALDSKAEPRSNMNFGTAGWAHAAGRQCFDLAVKAP
jgi:hypothetical protein